MPTLIICAPEYALGVAARKILAPYVNQQPIICTPDVQNALRGIREGVIVVVNDVMLEGMIYLRDTVERLDLKLN